MSTLTWITERARARDKEPKRPYIRWKKNVNILQEMRNASGHQVEKERQRKTKDNRSTYDINSQ